MANIPDPNGELSKLSGAQVFDALGLNAGEGFQVLSNQDLENNPSARAIMLHAEMTEKLLFMVFNMLVTKMKVEPTDALNAICGAMGSMVGEIMLMHKGCTPDTKDCNDSHREEIIEGLSQCMKLNALATFRTHELKA